jgi:Icc-related predicted phosphoesterase
LKRSDYEKAIGKGKFMKILYTSDLHGHKVLYESLVSLAQSLRPDLVLIGGDLLPKQGAYDVILNLQKEFASTELPKILRTLAESSTMVAYIFGNDDCMEATRNIPQGKRIYDCTNQIVELPCGIILAGFSLVPSTPFRLKDWERLEFPHDPIPNTVSEGIISDGMELKVIPIGEWVSSHLSLFEELNSFCFSKSPVLFLAHAPPYNTNLDIMYNDVHQGSKAIRRFIEKQQPRLSFHGHIHEAYAMSGNFVDSICKTTILCSGQIHQPMLDAIIVELSDDFSICNIMHTHTPTAPSAEGNIFLAPPY